MKRLFCAALAGLALAGCHRPASEPTPASLPQQTSPHIGSQSPGSQPPKSINGQAVIYVVNPKAAGNDDPLMARTVSLHQPQSPARSAVNALLADPNTPIPAGTALRGLTITDGIATLDFSRSPVNDTGGEGGQGDALTALGRTLGQFPDIQKFQISVKGRIVKTFGEFTTEGPMDVTRPEAKS